MSSYEDLLALENTKSIHQKHLHFLLKETYKSINKLNPEIMWDSFITKDISYSLRDSSKLIIPQANTFTFGVNSLNFRVSILWNSIPNYIKSSPTLTSFESALKKLNKIPCSCKICR